MKHFFFLLILALCACHEKEPPPINLHDAHLIETGVWADMTGVFPQEWEYRFQDGLLTQRFVKFGSVLTELQYPYAIRKDTVLIGGDATNTPRIWVLQFECTDVARVQNLGAMMGAVFWLHQKE